ncbi:AbrB family transcriptional regulator [Anoxybacter fermentans]|uniref:AbrB family transcriptional regulator n=1 Tax=Anoxybacter fermentans TaxID=1323375 RepID=A0A3Q9HPR1_9FIRM|nr:AbrB/MazE/SpoVT family DNA-binding domain-containing protein [Anoxybacter fermentans]AZR72787.1 AbrB family transcriptional regulator [Anoxybacter fermentans]
MKATGVVRQVDELGRVVLPIELRRVLRIAEKDPLEIFVDDDQIILKKYQPGCIFCGSAGDTTKIKNKIVCRNCIKELLEMVG